MNVRICLEPTVKVSFRIFWFHVESVTPCIRPQHRQPFLNEWYGWQVQHLKHHHQARSQWLLTERKYRKSLRYEGMAWYRWRGVCPRQNDDTLLTKGWNWTVDDSKCELRRISSGWLLSVSEQRSHSPLHSASKKDAAAGKSDGNHFICWLSSAEK